MKKNLLFLAVLVLFFSCSTEKPGKDEISAKVSYMVSQMTLKEKVGQMTQVTIDVLLTRDSDGETVALDDSMLQKVIVDYGAGSVLNTPKDHAQTPEKWYEIQSRIYEYVKKTRLKIPVIYGIDAIHGATYTTGGMLYPQEIGLAATRNKALVHKLAAVTAYETRASSIPWNFSPVLGVGRNPEWPRLYETFGEDVYLCETLGREMVEGYQGGAGSEIGPQSVAACAKHYLGYPFPLSGKDRTPAWIPERQLHEYFLPPFRAAVDAGVKTFMVNSGEMNGIPVHADKRILTGLLKEELGFKGFIVTDWQDIEYLHTRHKIAATFSEAVKLAVNAGIDMSMTPYDVSFADTLLALVEKGEVPESRIDDAVSRILRVKMELGLFVNPLTHPDDYAEFGGASFQALTKQAALESMTLLKNEEGILPLKPGTRVLVAGPNAARMNTLNGGWSNSWQGYLSNELAADYHTILEAVEEINGKGNTLYVPGVDYDEKGPWYADHIVDLGKVSSAARRVDVIVLCLGENSYTEKPGDLEDLYLSPNQVKLAQAAAKCGKPVVLVLTEGRPRIIREIEPGMTAILQAYLPGNFGGDAIAGVLFGKFNPSGKLPYTYPEYPNSLVPYDHKYTEELETGSQIYKSFFHPQFPFGFGLSYTTFTYSELMVDPEVLGAADTLKVSVKVTNTGDIEGMEAVECYVSDLYAEITPPVKRLRGFEKISLKPGESKTVIFALTSRDLAFVGEDLTWKTEKGKFMVTAGKLKKTFTVPATLTFDR